MFLALKSLLLALINARKLQTMALVISLH